MIVSSNPTARRRAALGASLIALLSLGFSATSQGADPDAAADNVSTTTPIKHLIVIIGENRSFDHVFATYVPQSADSIKNLLSEGIINANGTPGPKFNLAQQFEQKGPPFKTTFFISLASGEKTLYSTLPVPGLNFAPNAQQKISQFRVQGVIPPFRSKTSQTRLAEIEPSLDQDDLLLLTTGAAIGLVENPNVLAQDVDTRIANFAALPNGPFPLKGNALPYDSYTGDTTHRLFEMWQQSDCSKANAVLPQNPSGCLSDLYPYVITSYTGPADNGGSNSMAFYNMQAGDAPILKRLADQFSISDNFHQSGMGGTAINHIYLGSGDDIFYTDDDGNVATPSSHIANPNPMTGTDNEYIVDANFDGNFAECADPTQPGIEPIRDYLASLAWNPDPKCVTDHFYMINNVSPGFLPDGTQDTASIAAARAMGPSHVRTIGEALNGKGVSWAYYGGAYNAAVALQHKPHSNDPAVEIGQTYCNICNFESYSAAIMGDPVQRAAHIKDETDFFAAIDSDTLPSVSFVKPDGLLDGHPASSKLTLFEHMLENVFDHLNAKPELVAETAVIITFDEGGGYYDSGFIQPLDFFGDGPRIPLIVVSPFSKGGHVSHTYTDHVSILKFIERNWKLTPLTSRSRDNFPNPTTGADPYVPANSPAIGDLFDMFTFI